MPDLTPAESEALRAAAAGASTDELIYLLRAFLDADAEMRRSPHPRVELEIATVRTTRRPEPQALDTLLAKVEDALARFVAAGPAPGAAAAARPAVVQESLLASPARHAITPRARRSAPRCAPARARQSPPEPEAPAPPVTSRAHGSGWSTRS